MVTGVLRPLVHVYGTRYQHIYASVIVLGNLNGCSRLICLVLETVALCDISVRSAVYKSSYLLTYLLTPDMVMSSLIFIEIVGFGLSKGRKLRFPVTLAIGFYNYLCHDI